MRVLVTGAGGFFGGAFCRWASAAGWTVVGTGRRGDPVPAHLAGARYLRWDLTDGPLTPAQRERVGPVDVVVHAAAHVAERASLAQAWPVTVGGTRAVLATWPTARLVLVSSASVYHPYQPQLRAREDEAPDPRNLNWPNGYGPAKAAAERVALAQARGHPTAAREVVVLRPHAVYGPGDTTLAPRLLSAVRHGVLWLPGPGGQLHQLTHIDRLVAACALACTSGDAAVVRGGVFTIADGDPVPLGPALQHALAGLGVRVRPLGRRPALVLAAVTEPLGGPLTRYAAHHLACERSYDLTAATRLLGYVPGPTDLDSLRAAATRAAATSAAAPSIGVHPRR